MDTVLFHFASQNEIKQCPFKISFRRRRQQMPPKNIFLNACFVHFASQNEQNRRLKKVFCRRRRQNTFCKRPIHAINFAYCCSNLPSKVIIPASVFRCAPKTPAGSLIFQAANCFSIALALSLTFAKDASPTRRKY